MAVGELYGFMIVSYGPSGRVTRVRLEGSAGAKEVARYTFAAAMNLPTNFFSLSEQNFDEFLLMQNPNSETANVNVTYMMPGGTSGRSTTRWGRIPAAPSTSTASCRTPRCRPRSSRTSPSWPNAPCTSTSWAAA